MASAGRGQRAQLWRGRNFVDSSIPHGSTEPTSGGWVCQPGLSVANFFANCRKRLTEQNIPSPLAWAFISGIICPETNAPTGSIGLASANRLCQCSKGDVSWRGSACIWRCLKTRRVASLRPKQRSQSFRTRLPTRSCALGSGDIMSSTARWSVKRLAYAAIINCSAQEHDTPSTINDECDHCEK